MSQMVKLNDKVSEEIRTAYIQDKLLQRTNNIKPFLHIHTLLFGEILSQQYHGHDQFPKTNTFSLLTGTNTFTKKKTQMHGAPRFTPRILIL